MPKVYAKWQNPPKDVVYIGRPSKWGNPYKLKIDNEKSRREVLLAFEEYAVIKLKQNPDWLEPLRGKDLVCYCAPKMCHGDVLLKLANRVRIKCKVKRKTNND